MLVLTTAITGTRFHDLLADENVLPDLVSGSRAIGRDVRRGRCDRCHIESLSVGTAVATVFPLSN